MRQSLLSGGLPMTVRESSSLSELLELSPEVLVCEYRSGLIEQLQDASDNQDFGLVILGAPRGLIEEISPMGQFRGWALIPADCADDALLGAVLTANSGLVTYERPDSSSRGIPARSGDSSVALTDREKAVLQLISEGKANKQIASQIGLSIHTVKFHIASILEKLEATSRAEAVTLGIRYGLVIL